MSELPTWARDALAGIYDPCCQEKGISVIDMGLVRSVRVEDGKATVGLLLTSGWCPFAATVLTQVKEQILSQPGISDADVSIVWDEAWSPDRLSPLFHPQWALRAFKDFQIPQDLCDGYGYPQLTDQAKRKILGENLLRLHGMGLAEAKARLA
jgi:metal-sulfur cluster biosynthetic enzyme